MSGAGRQIRFFNTARRSVPAACVLVVAAAARFGNLRLLPPFIDESGHLALATRYDYYPLLERLGLGKVLGYFVFYPTAKFAGDPLYWTRFLVACLGVLTALGVFEFVRRVSSVRAAVIAGLLWALMPYVVFHDRMALHDPIGSLLVAWSMVVSVEAALRKSAKLSALSGFLLALAVLTKATNGLLAIGLVLIALAAGAWTGWRDGWKLAAGFLGGLLIPVSGMAAVLVTGVRGSANLLSSTAPGAPAGRMWHNLQNLVSWVEWYDSLPFLILATAALICCLARPSRMKLALLVAFLVSVMVQAQVFNQWYPRYLLPSLLPLVALLGLTGAEWMNWSGKFWERRFRRSGDWRPLGVSLAVVSMAILFLAAWIQSDIVFASSPSEARLPPVDRFQYVDGWPSAYGLGGVAAYLNREAEHSNQPLVVFVGGFGRHGWWSLPLVTRLNPKITLHPGFTGTPAELAQAAKIAANQPVYLLFEPPVLNPPDSFAVMAASAQLRVEYKRPHSDGGFQLFSLASQPMITKVTNPYGLERFQGKPFFWIGTGSAILDLDSPGRGTADLVANFFPGPSVGGKPERHLTIKAAGFGQTIAVTEGRRTIAVPVQEGSNQIVLSCSERPTGVRVPNGDTRALILGVQELHVGGFNPAK